eukprot:14010691-Heterocapsa_arctica.AAC.1
MRRQEKCATVTGLLDDGRITVRVDNAGEETIDPKPSTIVLARTVRRSPGTRIVLVQERGLADAKVVKWCGPETGNRHSVQLLSGE